VRTQTGTAHVSSLSVGTREHWRPGQHVELYVAGTRQLDADTTALTAASLRQEDLTDWNLTRAHHFTPAPRTAGRLLSAAATCRGVRLS
jgi:hypothetical protein